MYLSEEYEENKNRILKECAYTKKKHEEIEKRYKRLVEPAPQFNFAVKRKEASPEPKNGLDSQGIKQYREISENLQKEFSRDFCEDAEIVQADLLKSELLSESEDETETKAENEASGRNEAGDENALVGGEKSEAEAPAKMAVGNFESFYEKNLAEVLEQPEFEEIRKFIGEETDFSKEGYKDLMKAFGMDAETNVEVIDKESDSESEPANENADAKSESDLADSEKIITDVEVEIVDISVNDGEIHEGLGKVFAVPIERDVEKKSFALEPMKFRIIKAALAAAVMVVGAIVIYSIW